MDRIQELRDRRQNLIAEMKAICDAAKLANRSFAEEERTRLAELQKADDDAKAELDKLEADQVLHQRVGQIAAESEQPRGRRSEPDLIETSLSRITVKDNILDDPKKGFRTPREFMLCVMDAGRGRAVDARLKYLAVGSDEARGSSDPAGGFLLPESFSPNLLQLRPETDPISAFVTDVPMTTPILRIPARVDKDHSTSVSGGLLVTRRPETVTGKSSLMTFERVTLEAHELFGLAFATEEVLTDSPISFVALLEAGFRDEFPAHILNERINGTGVGEFLGVLNCPCLITVLKESGQAVKTIAYENVIKMRARCWGYGRAVWLANQDTMPQLMLMNQTVGTGGVPVWQPSGRDDHPDVLLGRPLIFTEYAQTLGAVGDLILGNWMEFLEGTYQPLQSAESIHVRFVNHERTFKFWLRNAGVPWWRSVLKPKNSAETLSPFVVLEAR